MKTTQRILIAVLNWGLGHATRTSEIIEKALKQGHEVILVSDGVAGLWLKRKYPKIQFEHLAGYNVMYHRYLTPTLSILLQAYKLSGGIKKEQKKFEKLVEKVQPDLIISDNRYGCYSHKVKSVFMGHQLNIHPFVNWVQKGWLSVFDEIWVPDYDNRMLSGKLSESDWKNVRYIGPLSQFKGIDSINSNKNVVIISGPDPKRKQVLKKWLKWAKRQKAQFDLLSPLAAGVEVPENVIWHYKTTQEDRNRLLSEAKHLICTAGYSSLMDVHVLGKFPLVFPTPGQREQKYLAKHWVEEGIALPFNFRTPFHLQALEEGKDSYPVLPNLVIDDLFDE